MPESSPERPAGAAPDNPASSAVASVKERRAAARLVRRLRSGRTPVWQELALIVWMCWLYDAIANLAPLRAATAHRNAGAILRFERALHLDPEVSLDHWLSHHHTLASVLSNYYDNAHFVITLGLVGLIWWRWPDRYRPLRNSLVLTNVIAMVVFWLVPMAPPRLYDPSVYIDVVAQTHAFGSWHSGTLATAANQLAAMPSLHIGWAAWSALAAWRILPRRRWTGLVWLYPVVTAVVVMATGNHFLCDVLAGAATLAISTLVADRWEGWWANRQARRALAEASTGAMAGDPVPASASAPGSGAESRSGLGGEPPRP